MITQEEAENLRCYRIVEAIVEKAYSSSKHQEERNYNGYNHCGLHFVVRRHRFRGQVAD